YIFTDVMVNNYESNDYSKENDKTREIRFFKRGTSLNWNYTFNKIFNLVLISNMNIELFGNALI
ncbi:hypothetical protein, partial [Staphylococcus warneri]|uniref:hypothetical protein n=1 Tax=Staphylococcus warneri TaxID=1292 RepID=UPI001A7E180A